MYISKTCIEIPSSTYTGYQHTGADSQHIGKHLGKRGVIVYAVSIGTTRYLDELAEYMEGALHELRTLGGYIVQGFHYRGKTPYLTYRIEKVPEEEKTVSMILAQALTKFLTDTWERDWLQRVIEREYDYYNADEVSFLADRGIEFLRNHSHWGKQILRNHEIESCIADYLMHNRTFIVEGFIRFRLRDFEEDRYRAIEYAIDQYLMDQEYREFIRLLRYFLDFQESDLPLVHFVCNQHQVLLIDQNGFPIKDKELIRFSQDLLEKELPADDLILSTLISLAPRQVKVHTPLGTELPEIAETVFSVFEQRVEMCPGCTLCNTQSEELEYHSLPLTFFE